MNAFLLAGTLALAAAVLCHGAATLSLRNTALFLGTASVLSLAAEYASIRWGVPFGETYSYHGDLRPRLLGVVPLFIPLAWAVLAYGPVMFLRPLAVRANGRWSAPRILIKAGLGGLYLMGLDLFLDPLAVSVGAWTWARRGPYFGIPLGNFGGWWVVGLAIYVCYFLLERPGPVGRGPERDPLDWMFVIASVGFALLTVPALLAHVGSLLPLAIALPILAPFWAYWFIATTGRPRSRRAQTSTERHPVACEAGRGVLPG